ncbi:MAG TPA: cytosine deaminase [Bauldia sp.]|nr:cytosine deaminase [Bauldia sp.]
MAETGFAAVPDAPRYVIANATIPGVLLEDSPVEPDAEGLCALDLVVAGGRVERLTAADSVADAPRLDLGGGMVWPAFVDMHTHIDKGHIWPRRPNPDGTFMGALDAVAADRAANWSAEDVRRRMDFSLRTAYAHGTALLRTHLDSVAPQHRISWPVFAEMRERWAGRIELQAVSIVGIDELRNQAYAEDLIATVAEHGGILGAVTYMVPDLERLIEMMMLRAANRGLDLDFHVDETGDPAAHSLRLIADTALRTDFPGRIVAGHCCSLAVQPRDEAEATMERVAEAGIAVVSLPMCNMYLQDRNAGRTPRWRGVTLIHELMAHDVPVAVASDNTRDPFYAYGDLDMLEVLREAVRIIHLDHPISSWASLVARSPAAIVGAAADHGLIGEGRISNLVLFRARSWTELLARPQSDRTVIRAGRAIDRTLPDYRELDDLVGVG